MILLSWQGNKIKNEKSLPYAIAGGVLFLASFILLLMARSVGGFAEWYAKTIYKGITQTVGKMMGLIPFSMSELILYILLMIVAVATGRVIYQGIWKRNKVMIGHYLLSAFLGSAILFFIFTVNCGINYERLSFAETSGIGTMEYSEQKLKEVCLWLTARINENAGKVERSTKGAMVLKEGEEKEASKAMGKLGEIYPELSGTYPPPKGLWNSVLLSVQNLTGIYSPFTVEANYNKDMTAYNIPFTVCHELSHLRGFMQEEEANFIAWLACSGSERIDFKYSADMMGWIYCMNVLRKVDAQAYNEVRGQMSPLAEVDLKENNQFWKKYDTRLAEVSNKVNDTYLKANGQMDGVASYDRMVDLLVTYYLNTNG